MIPIGNYSVPMLILSREREPGEYTFRNSIVGEGWGVRSYVGRF